MWDCFIYLWRRPAKIAGEPIHTDSVLSCLWWKLVRGAPTHSLNENLWRSKRFPEMNRSPCQLVTCHQAFFFCFFFQGRTRWSQASQLAANYPCLRGFSWNFSSGKWKLAAKRRQRVQKRRGERERENPSLSSSLRDSLSASNVGSLALSRIKFSRKTCGPRVSANQLADDLKIVLLSVQSSYFLVHTDGQGHSHRRFRGRLCSSLTACRTTKVVLRALRTYR